MAPRKAVQKAVPENPAPDNPESNPAISRLLTAGEVAAALHLKSTGTLAVWRATKRYELKFVRIGRKIFYRAEHVQAFIEARTGLDTTPCDQGWRR